MVIVIADLLLTIKLFSIQAIIQAVHLKNPALLIWFHCNWTHKKFLNLKTASTIKNFWVFFLGKKNYWIWDREIKLTLCVLNEWQNLQKLCAFCLGTTFKSIVDKHYELNNAPMFPSTIIWNFLIILFLY